jgi:hypothetical protein
MAAPNRWTALSQLSTVPFAITWNDRCNFRLARGDEQVAEGTKPGERVIADREGG